MLNNEDRKLIGLIIEELISELKTRAVKVTEFEKDSDTIKRTIVDMTVGKIAPKSKIILNKVYNMLKDDTLKKDFFIQHKAAFYEKDILGQLNKKFHFETPQIIDIKSCGNEINEWKKAGGICVAGGVVSFVVRSSVPVCIAVLVAGLMMYIGSSSNNKNNDIHAIINEYFESIRMALFNWVETIELFYDQQIREIEKEFSR